MIQELVHFLISQLTHHSILTLIRLYEIYALEANWASLGWARSQAEISIPLPKLHISLTKDIKWSSTFGKV